VRTQAGHCDASKANKNDVAVMINLHDSVWVLYIWRITYRARFVPYFAAIEARGIIPKVAINKIELDDEKTYATAKGWSVEKERLEIEKGEMLVWSGHLWHAGGEVASEEGGGVLNAAWWARLNNGSHSVYAATAHEENAEEQAEERKIPLRMIYRYGDE